MKNSKLYALSSWFGFLLLLLWMTSCGTRKVQTSNTKKVDELEQKSIDKKDLTVQDTSNVKVTNKVESTDETTTEKKIYTPIDPTKPSTFIDDKGNKKELNNTSYTEEKTSSKSNKKAKTNTETSSNTKIIDKGIKSSISKIKVKVESKNKESERTSLRWIWLLWLIPIILIIYLFWKYKDKIWWV
jgi:ATP-dependent Zn protease